MDLLAEDRRRMVEVLSTLSTGEGARVSQIEGVVLLRATKSCVPVPVLYEPCIVIVAQGRKRFYVPDGVLAYDARRYLVVTVPVPADCETTVDRAGPFLGIAVRIDLSVLGELLLTLGSAASAHNGTHAEARFCAPRVNASISAISVRLTEALASPADAKILGPHLVRELLYRVLQGPAGGSLRHLLLGHEGRAQVHRILEHMHLHYASPLDVVTLAHEIGMSSSALHHHFKAVTSTSPVQYLKALRLHKARMLMVQGSLSAGLAAERVGYKSPSQFSREFKRHFGVPPADEAQRVRAAFGFTDEVAVAV